MFRPDGGHVDSKSGTQVSEAMHKAEDAEKPAVQRLRDVKMWLLVDANRWAVVAILGVAVYVTTVPVGLFGPVSVRQFLVEGTSTADAYIEIQTMIVSVMTIVLAINQLVLSPEVGPIGKQRMRLDDIISYRTKVEDVADKHVTSMEPAEFLQTIARSAGSRGEKLRDAVSDADREVRRSTRQFVEDVIAEADRVDATLEGQRFGTTRMLGSIMEYDTAQKLHDAQRIRNEHQERLSDVHNKASTT